MIAHRNFESQGPITWVGSFPVYATTGLVALHVVTMTACALAEAFGLDGVLGSLRFSSEHVRHSFAVWQCFTYAFVHQPSLFFAIEMLMLFMFGREVEAWAGRNAFLQLYAALVLAGPVILLLATPLAPSTTLSGSGEIHFAVFLAFATIHPSAPMFFSLTARWVAVILFALYGLQLLAQNSWSQLAVLLGTCALAITAVRRGPLVDLDLLRRLRPRPSHPRRPHLRVLPKPETEPGDIHATIDPLLEKISRHGISSLSPREREQLERARHALLEKEKSP